MKDAVILTVIIIVALLTAWVIIHRICSCIEKCAELKQRKEKENEDREG